MSNPVISRRYARALLNLAVKEKQMEPVTEGLEDIADAMETSPELGNMIADPKVPQAEKQKVIEALMEKAGVAPLVNNFVRLVASKRRLILLPEIRDLFHALADERMGRGMAEVTAATDLTQAQQDSLRTKLESLSGKTISLKVNVDPSMLGGVVARVGSTVWDGSLRNQLNQIRQSIIEG